MRKRTSDRIKDITDRLQREIERDSTSFSPRLHARIMREVRAAVGDEETNDARRWGWRWPAIGGLAAAAVIAGILLWQSPATSPPAPPSQLAVQPPSLPDIGPLFNRAAPADDALARALEQHRLVHLDDNARRLGRFVLDQVSMATPPQVP